MLSHLDSLFVNSKSNIEQQEIPFAIEDPDSDKVHITLKQIVRDWSDLGAEERDQAYKPILKELQNHFDVSSQKSQFKVVS